MNETVHLIDNNSHGTPIPKESIQDVLQISNIGRLQNAPDLLVFPHSFSELKDGIGDLSIVTLHEAKYIDGKCVSVKACTGNLMGFVGFNDTSLSIHSRFIHKKENGEIDPSSPDNFLYYMLHKVFSINVFSLKHASSREDKILDFLLFLFPLMLKKAMSQGLYKEYRRFLYDDDRVKGSIDVCRFIRKDTQFKGNISYTTREYSYDNTITQLIRHTIEYIKHHPFGNSILNNDSGTIEYVRQIITATPSYSLRERQRVINANIRPKVHPYFTKYKELQQLCVHILRHESLKYGEEKDSIHGVLFDGAWLWEEYLAIVLKGKFNHYLKNSGKRYYLFTPNMQQIIPDYLSLNKEIVADAKYIPLDKENSYGDEKATAIYYKTITYMYRFCSDKGFLLYPHPDKDITHKLYTIYAIATEKKGVNGGNIIKVGLRIPSNCKDFADFVEKIKINESNFLNDIAEAQKTL